VFVRVFGESSAAGWRRVSACVRRREGAYEVVRADVDPRDEVGLRHVLAVEELVEVLGGAGSEHPAVQGKLADAHNDGLARQVHVEHAARARLVLLADRDREVVARPVRVVQQTLRAHDRLRARQRARSRRGRTRTLWIGL
jgi:hypothetical protein